MSLLSQKIKAHIFRHRFRFTLAFALTLLATGFQALSPWPFKILIDNVLGGELIDIQTPLGAFLHAFNTRESLAFIVVFLFFGIHMASSLIDYIRSFHLNHIMRDVIQRFTLEIFENIEAFDLGYYKKQAVGDYVYRLSYDASAIASFLEFGIIPIITNSLYLIITSIILFSIHTQLAWLSLISLPFLAFGLRYFNSRLTVASQVSETKYSGLFSFIEQALSQLKIIQAYRQERNQLVRFNQKITESLTADFTVYNLNLLVSLFIGALVAITYALVVGVGVAAVFAGQISTGIMIVYIFYLDNLTQPVIDITDAITSSKRDWVSLKRLEELMDAKHHTQDVGGVTQIDDHTVSFNKVNLVGDHGEKILDNISCIIPKEKISYIIGISGSGKSSLTSLILRLMHEPESGSIMLGNYTIRDYNLKVLRENIALVPQETALFNDSIYDIIAFGNPNASFEQIREAARLAVAEEFILKHPGGFQFKVGERGELLSGGQRQRLCLARAYLKKAPIMIMDEVFSGQDPLTKRQMLTNLRKFAHKRTLIIVTNVLDIINPEDHAILIDRGQIRFEGDFASLQRGQAVSSLLRIQPIELERG